MQPLVKFCSSCFWISDVFLWVPMGVSSLVFLLAKSLSWKSCAVSLNSSSKLLRTWAVNVGICTSSASDTAFLLCLAVEPSIATYKHPDTHWVTHSWLMVIHVHTWLMCINYWSNKCLAKQRLRHSRWCPPRGGWCRGGSRVCWGVGGFPWLKEEISNVVFL